MKFSEVFPGFEKTGMRVWITMDGDAARLCTPAQATTFSRMKFEKLLKIAQKLPSNEDFYPMLGADTCPLCALYLRWNPDRDKDGCYGCPIQRKTGKHTCEGTPYDPGIMDAVTVADYIPALKAEIGFLKEIEAEL